MRHHRGMALVIATLVLLGCIFAVFAIGLAGASGGAERERASQRALAEAREALIAYAADHPINAVVGPGYLPCPDLDDDGWAESTCGSQSGDSGQGERLGRLPWKTLGLADLRDGHGERLWYAVSSKYKGLLNCGVSRACLDMTPEAALGTITVRDNAGSIMHDGTVGDAYRADAGGAVAVVIAPGPPIARDGEEQRRECAPGDCDATGRCVASPAQRAARCNPANFLDKAVGARFADEDNADFVDRNDAAGRPLNRNGFIQGPVTLADGRPAVNDRIAVVAYRDVMPRIRLRVALEVSRCLRHYATRAENRSRYPWATPACLQAGGGWDARSGVLFGRIPDTPLAAAPMLDRWWSGFDPPGANDACRIAMAPGSADEGETAGGSSWWSAWKPYVFYALARGVSPDSAGASCEGGTCLELADPAGRTLGTAKQYAVIVAGAPLARDGFVQSRAGANVSDVRQWLEEANAELEGAAGCTPPPAFTCEGRGTCNRVTAGGGTRAFNDVVVAYP
jgi:type II secretory pathway pseudopilin PulG